MKNALSFNVGGIKCDNKNCDYKDINVKVEDYDKWLNKSCPKCGSNLLTQEDYDNVKMLIEVTNSLNKILPQINDDEEIIKMSIEMNGTGEMSFKEIK